ncbi:MAG: BtpA/SgcQ family protein [Acidimicrobiia bacterium]
MVHLLPLPGTPRFQGSIDTLIERAVDDAMALEQAGFDAVIVENFGDIPFFKDAVPPVTIASMALAVARIINQVSVPVGVNVLRNDALAALAIAATTGASFIRVNVLSGVMFTDQGIIEGRAAEIARIRAEIAPHIQVFADVFVKHAVPPVGLELTRAAEDLAFRAGADALILSGSATGSPTGLEPVEALRRACPHVPLLVGSGATADSVVDLLEHVDGVIVGTAIEVDGRTANPVDPRRAAEFVRAARATR